MTATADSISSTRSRAGRKDPAADHRARHGGFGSFWLRALYWSAWRAPAFSRLTRPFWVNAAWLLSPALRARMLANAKWLLPEGSGLRERRRLARKVIANSYAFVQEIGIGCRTDPQVLAGRVRATEGKEHYDRARSKQRGLIVATAHLGAFVTGMAAIRALENRVHVVFRRDLDSAFDDIRSRLHQHLGVIEAPVDDGWDTWINLRDALLSDEVVLIQADRAMPGERGLCVPFCGGHIMVPLGAAKLAALTGAPIVPVFAIQDARRGIRICIEPAMEVGSDRDEVERCVRALAGVIETKVLAYPEQWLTLHRAWCEDMEPCETGRGR